MNMIVIDDLQKGSIVMYQDQPVVITGIYTNPPSPPCIKTNQGVVEINELKPAFLKDILHFFKYDPDSEIYSNNVSFIDIKNGNAVMGPASSSIKGTVMVPCNEPVHLIQKQHANLLLTLW